MDSDEQAILETFRSAALGMTRWTTALERLNGALGGRIGQIAVVDRSGDIMLNLLGGASPDEELAYLAAGGPDPARNPRTRGILQAAPRHSIVDSDFVTPAERERSAIYRTLFRQGDVPHSLQIRMPSPTGATVISLQRPRSSGEADTAERRRLEALAGGIDGAVQAGLFLGRTIDGELLTTAEDLAGAAMLLGADMTLLSLSGAAESLLHGDGLRLRGGRIEATDPRDHTALERAFRAVTEAPSTARGVTRVVLRRSAGAGIPVDLSPLPRRIAGPLSLARALLTVRQPRIADDAQAARNLANAFGLTGSEAHVALLLVDGLTMQEVAARRGATIATVRTQLKAIFEKTGYHRQAELVLALRPYRQL